MYRCPVEARSVGPLFSPTLLTGHGSMSLVRIFILHPSMPGSAWHVSEDGREGESYKDGLMAMHAACDRARILEAAGFDVQVRAEGADGTWQIIRE